MTALPLRSRLAAGPFLGCAALVLSALAALAQSDPPEPEISADEFPRAPATEPRDALATFEMAPGFDLTLAAHEPAVVDPIAMCFDEKGRAYVVEMVGYSERRDDEVCQIRLLTDEDGDGVFDRSVVFKDKLKWPSAILCYKGGVFVGASPDLYYFKDTTGDGVCDEERTVFTGFGSEMPRLNMQALFNSLRWGPDNRVWAATAGNAGIVTRPDDPSFEPVNLRGSDFSFDPEALDLRTESGTAQYGMSYDSLGRRFVCSNSRHLIWVAYERGQVRENPWYSLPAPLVDVAADGPAPTVHRISPDEPWRIVRTRWRVAGVVRGIVEGGGRVSGFLVAATGIHLYWGDAFPAEFRDNAFIGDVGSNLIHRKVMRTEPGSVQPVGMRPDPEEQTEFLRSSDYWFRPCAIVSGPDGCLYVADMYREVIEHPWSLPEPIKKHLDLNSGNDRGRIYRIAPEGFQRPEIPDLGALSDGDLLALAGHPNDWHRTTARRLLYERGKPTDPIPAVEPFPAALAAATPLLDRIEGSLGDRWMEAAVLNSLRSPADLAAAWKASAAAPAAFRTQLAGMVGRANDAVLLAAVSDDLAAGTPDAGTVAILTSLRDGLARAKGDWRALAASSRWEAITGKAIGLLSDSTAATAARVAAVRFLALVPTPDTQERFQSVLLEGKPDPALAAALVGAISDLGFLIDRFTSLESSARDELGGRILAAAKSSEVFLGAVREGKVPLDQAPASLIENLRRHADEAVRKLAAEVLPPVVERADVIAAYQPALQRKGDLAKGKLAFMKACLACHKTHEGEGIQVGPPIESFAAAGAETLLGHILDPNREVAPQYQAYTYELTDGTVATGFILTENSAEITLRMPGGIDKTFSRGTVASMKGLGQSLMPEGLEATLTVEEMADLLAYITTPPTKSADE
jgi:putative membrane-bound dehydrogenase-like protein